MFIFLVEFNQTCDYLMYHWKISYWLTVTGKANGAPPVKLVLVGSIPTPKFFSNIIKNFEGGSYVSFGME